jgi:hypothetical protein
MFKIANYATNINEGIAQINYTRSVYVVKLFVVMTVAIAENSIKDQIKFCKTA